MKEWFTLVRKVLPQQLIGITLTVLSFVFFYRTSPWTNLLCALFYAADTLLLLCNLNTVVKTFELSKKKHLFWCVMATILYFAFFFIVSLLFTEGHLTVSTTLQWSIFLGPSLILLLPIYYLICEIAG